MAYLSLFGSYTHSKLILIQILYLFRFLVCCTELIQVLILISSLYLFRSPVGVTELMLIQRYFVSYTCTTEHILVLRILY